MIKQIILACFLIAIAYSLGADCSVDGDANCPPQYKCERSTNCFESCTAGSAECKTGYSCNSSNACVADADNDADEDADADEDGEDNDDDEKDDKDSASIMSASLFLVLALLAYLL
ncbi:hypothetical protein PPERSA_03119 [Pseudocohnilembus persalinus]|uniref:Uncharacterized protein n=1 Tax=Pseudocohnilembus persalinus TaxID=266149 RepID=A0A0V0QRT3_PSEPJ|nr:hypothetical protein PPERSA_03119 [Pseudocohnilembus persalinus]|eukprot:KRX04728.1 hypothetical protein PPERSA_03119 [Pseudocohnilembus persalinus]